MSQPDTVLPATIAAYSQRFHASLSGHHIASPLGAWLLTALASKGAKNGSEEYTTLTQALGMKPEVAFARAKEILSNPREGIASAAAVWIKPAAINAAYKAWVQEMGDAVSSGEMPTQEEADAWTKEKTLDLISKFPGDVEDPLACLALVTALAVKGGWTSREYDVVENETLSAWNVKKVLSKTEMPESNAWIHEDNDGTYGVHVNDTTNGLRVFSVIGAEGESQESVLAKAHKIALMERPSRSSLFEMEIGQQDFFRVEEETRRLVRGSSKNFYNVALPAWKADNNHDLTQMCALEMGTTGRVLADMLALNDFSCDAQQVATASYSATGFEAAAVTYMRVGLRSMPQYIDTKVRVCSIDYNRPYAVVAVVGGNRLKPTVWDGLPLFSAWVEEATEA